ncbi:Ca2+-binding RTX toxin-like protein [Amaricoccus macauensis]|uniref:Ca2+-binding RTX toxin-like protein n=1 Tax=Amaricoccus macauensis TaxID=57001 RepID=A0A840SSS7_9RHOB|nr:calcium-binding protein [Amaricoccus macauensis]MBB5223658.1 Ca2+-binding RTX toxin-like protein [Amaricoccus macauensis]
MKTTIITESVINDGEDPIFTFTEDDERLVVNRGVTLSNGADFVISAYESSLSNLQAVINGTVQATYGAWSPVMAYPSAMHLTVGKSGKLLGGLIGFEATGDSSLVNNGLLHATIGASLGYPSEETKSLVVNNGTIFGDSTGLSLSGKEATVVNQGLIKAESSWESWTTAIQVSSISTTVVNDGSIVADNPKSVGIKAYGNTDPLPAQTLLVENSGTVTSLDRFGIQVNNGVVSTIVNSGTISGGKESIHLSYGADTVTNDGSLVGAATLGAGNDIYHGENGQVSGPVMGGGGADLLVGGAKADVFAAGVGSDTLMGGGGNDTLTGAGGADVISGGAGADVFRFAAASDAIGDRIVTTGSVAAFQGVGVTGGDRIDLSLIDANPDVAGQQHFNFGTSRGVGDLWSVDVGDVTHIRGNIGAGMPKFDLAIHDGAGVHASDYAAIDFIL